jgi:exonuclease SbcD
MNLVHLGAKGQITIETLPFRPDRQLKIIEGSFEDLQRLGESAPSMDFVKAIITDEGGLIAPADKLRTYYPNLMQIERPNRGRSSVTSSVPTNHDRNDPSEVVNAFIAYVRDEAKELEQVLIAETLEQLRLEEEAV